MGSYASCKGRSLIAGMLIMGLVVALITVWSDENESRADRGYTAEEVDPALLDLSILEGKASAQELTPEEERKRRMLGSRLMDRVLGTFMAHYIVEGEIVDQDGNRLEDVHLLVNKAKARGPDRWAEEREEKKVSGMFSLDLDGYTALHLYFNKEGFYQEMLSFGFEGNSTTGDDIVLRDRPLRRSVVEKRDIRVVLEKMGDITKLLPFQGPLEFLAPSAVQYRLN